MQHNLSFSEVLNSCLSDGQLIHCAGSGANSSEATAGGKADLLLFTHGILEKTDNLVSLSKSNRLQGPQTGASVRKILICMDSLIL